MRKGQKRVSRDREPSRKVVSSPSKRSKYNQDGSLRGKYAFQEGNKDAIPRSPYKYVKRVHSDNGKVDFILQESPIFFPGKYGQVVLRVRFTKGRVFKECTGASRRVVFSKSNYRILRQEAFNMAIARAEFSPDHAIVLSERYLYWKEVKRR